jgi:ubiquinone/menaquinone biosynthesis C-methylase UbiE
MSPAALAKNESYLLGQTQRETRRLLLQASILNPLTDRFLRSSGIRRGMKVLDVGCGAGDVSMIAAALAGSDGEVVGIDRSDAVLELARERASGSNLHNLRFECGDIMNYEPGERFDAVIGRHVLLHVADAPSALRRVASWLVPGGIAAFQEYDFSSWQVGYPEVPLAAGLAESVVQLMRRATPSPDLGVRLFHFMLEAGFSEPKSMGECVMEGGPHSVFYEWFGETLLSMLPAMRRLGITADVDDEETLSARVREEFLSAQACMASPLIVSTSALHLT